jgi:hypothetical protein
MIWSKIISTFLTQGHLRLQMIAHAQRIVNPRGTFPKVGGGFCLGLASLKLSGRLFLKVDLQF